MHMRSKVHFIQRPASQSNKSTERRQGTENVSYSRRKQHGEGGCSVCDLFGRSVLIA
jgi:hypothetical protein